MKLKQKRTVNLDAEDVRIENGFLAVTVQDPHPRNPREDKDRNVFRLVQRPKLWSDDNASLEDLADAMKQSWDRWKNGEFPWKDVCAGNLDVIRDCAEKTDAVVFPVYRHEHGSVSYSVADFGDRWDSSCSGLAWASREDLEKVWGRDVPDADGLQKSLESELAEFEAWTNGDVYVCDIYAPEDFKREPDGSILLKEDADPVETCGNLLGMDAVEAFIGDACAPQNGPRA